jgi:hypothetical protein
MQWTIILEATTGWGERTSTPVYTFSRPMLDLKPEQIGLTLAEAKTLLARLQARLVCQQADEYATCRRVCPRCHQMQPVKEYQPRVLDTLFGPVHLDSPRWQVCRCRCHWDHPPTFSPLSEILPRRYTPELEYLLARFASLMPYRQVVQLLQECFPVSPTLNHVTVRRRTLRVAQRMEADLTAEAATAPACPPPAGGDGVLICIDTGFVRSCHPKGARDFEVTVGRCERPGGSGESFGFVADPEVDPLGKARWPVLLGHQGHPPGEPLTVMSDGAEAFLNLAQRLGATHIMDWFHVAMRFKRLHQILRGLRWSYPLEIEGWKDTVARAKWRLWHGQADRADQALGELAADLDPRLSPATPPWSSPLLRLRSAVGEVQAYLRANASSLVDYARRYLRGQRISTAVVESMVNRVIGRRRAKKQPMRWSRRGAHLLVQIRVAVLDGRLPHLFQRWYPRFRPPEPATP